MMKFLELKIRVSVTTQPMEPPICGGVKNCPNDGMIAHKRTIKEVISMLYKLKILSLNFTNNNIRKMTKKRLKNRLLWMKMHFHTAFRYVEMVFKGQLCVFCLLIGSNWSNFEDESGLKK